MKYIYIFMLFFLLISSMYAQNIENPPTGVITNTVNINATYDPNLPEKITSCFISYDFSNCGNSTFFIYPGNGPINLALN